MNLISAELRRTLKLEKISLNLTGHLNEIPPSLGYVVKHFGGAESSGIAGDRFSNLCNYYSAKQQVKPEVFT